MRALVFILLATLVACGPTQRRKVHVKVFFTSGKVESWTYAPCWSGPYLNDGCLEVNGSSKICGVERFEYRKELYYETE